MIANHLKTEGAKNITEALGIEPKELATVIHAGYFFFKQGKIRQALDLLEAVSLLDDSNPYVHAILGSIYQKQQRFDDSVTSYTRALYLFPGDIYSLTNRGEVYLNQGKLVEAAHDFEEAIRFDINGKHPAANRARFLVIQTQKALIAASEKQSTA